MLKPVQASVFVLVVLTGCSASRRSPSGQETAEPDTSPPAVHAAAKAETVAEAPKIASPPEISVAESPVSRSYADTWIPLSRWSRENGFGTARRVGNVPEFALTTSNGVFLLHPGSLLAAWDGLELLLAFEPQLINDQPFVHWLDLKKNVEPLARGFLVPAPTNRVIVIDPGHGGQNTGASSVVDGRFEKEFTLDWAKRMQPLFEARGWHVVLTRTNDVDLALSNRVACAQECHADLFISLHFNSAAPSRDQSGLETYCLTPTGMPSTLTRGYDDDLSASFPNNAFDEENLRYAVEFHRALLAVAGVDRGVRRARFLGVLRGQQRPAILIEGGYLSNPVEAGRIADADYRQRLAEAVAGALDVAVNPARQPVLESASTNFSNTTVSDHPPIGPGVAVPESGAVPDSMTNSDDRISPLP